MKAFIVRPFGEKNGIDFDRVERDLIKPALKALDIPGGTTGLITYAGNIRTDMFEQLLVADLVIADISIHNANVFYELGVRHGLRDKRTFLIRCAGDEVPFDLKTDRYLEYDKANPAAILPALIGGLKATSESDRRDSPVFLLLPELQPPKREAFLIVPQEFGREVERAREKKHAGDLALLAAEARNTQWEVEALRVVGRAQFRLKANPAARATWERVLEFYADDLEANLLLGTIYHRLGDLTASDDAIKKALKARDLPPAKRAETQALLGRNAKTRWQDEWMAVPEKAAETALQSSYLAEAQEQYELGFQEDQNHFYSGLNALALFTVRLQLAQTLPETWDLQFRNNKVAQAEFAELQGKRAKLTAAVEHSLGAAAERLKKRDERDIWVDLSNADFCCLTLEEPKRAAAAYKAVIGRADPFEVDSVRRKLLIYQQLGILRDNVAAALAALPEAPVEEKKARPLHVFLFTGHQMDKPGRTPARFPAEKEEIARRRIKEELERASKGVDAPKLGLAGAASGGDILFHEVCAELGIPTRVYLALPENKFINESVAPAEGNWVGRFRALLQSKKENEVRQLAEADEMPKWLRDKDPDYGIWQRNNLWMLHNALALGGKHSTLIALWNGEGGDGPGGTKDMVEQAGELGARTIIIDTKTAFGS